MVKSFLKYIEIKTKITSIFAFLITIAYLFYQRQPIRWGLTLLFFISMLLFDMTTTAINNYIDTKTNEQVLPFGRRAALLIIGALLAASTLTGLILAWRTDVIVLLMGGLCFICGVLYTYGPVPLSRLPLGEIASGVFYGFFIPFLILYINLPAGTLLSLSLQGQTLALTVQLAAMARLALFSVIPMLTTANIMLANNICDVNKDVAVGRYTLAYFLGRRAIWLFDALYYACLVSIVVMVGIGMLSPLCLIALVTAVPIQKNISIFHKKQVKEETFIVSIQNYLILMGGITVVIFVSRFLG